MDKIHVFEAAGLGLAPFRLVDIWKSHATCDYCGTGILWNCIVESADGRQFRVGRECVNKTGDAGMIKRMTDIEKSIKKAENRAKSAERCKARVEASRAREAARKASEASYEDAVKPLKKQLLKYHRPIILVLDEIKSSGFAEDIAGSLRNEFRPLDGFTANQLDYMRHLYAKSFGRTNSKKYIKAAERFDVLASRTSNKVRKLRDQSRAIPR